MFLVRVDGRNMKGRVSGEMVRREVRVLKGKRAFVSHLVMAFSPGMRWVEIWK